MQFKLWMETWYHGTRAASQIREQGFTASTAGGGQKGLMGVWLTKDYTYADVYANVLTNTKGDPEVLATSIPENINVANLTNIKSSNPGDYIRDLWMFVGLDIDKDEGAAQVRTAQPFALTKILKKQGYDAALIPNTIRENGPPELVIFDPSQVTLID